jgi:HSP20 family protein
MPCDPLRDLRAWQERMERLAGQQHGSPGWTPPTDVYETADRYVVTAEVPGLRRDQIDVSVEDGRLTIRGTRDDAGDAGEFHQIERGHGPFARTFAFADPIAAGSVTADLRDGVLTVTVPKESAPPPRKIDVS